MRIAVDASALLAIYFEEAEGPLFEAFIVGAAHKAMSAVNYWEAMERVRVMFGKSGVAEMEAFMTSLGIVIEPVSEAQARLAVEASGRFGKSHSAKLNMGDCFAYALSKTTQEPLLFKGNAFPQTDVSAAL